MAPTSSNIASSAPTGAKPKSGNAANKSAANASFGMNMPLMSSAFDTAMWLNAA